MDSTWSGSVKLEYFIYRHEISLEVNRILVSYKTDCGQTLAFVAITSVGGVSIPHVNTAVTLVTVRITDGGATRQGMGRGVRTRLGRRGMR